MCWPLYLNASRNQFPEESRYGTMISWSGVPSIFPTAIVPKCQEAPPPWKVETSSWADAANAANMSPEQPSIAARTRDPRRSLPAAERNSGSLVDMQTVHNNRNYDGTMTGKVPGTAGNFLGPARFRMRLLGYDRNRNQAPV